MVQTNLQDGRNYLLKVQIECILTSMLSNDAYFIMCKVILNLLKITSDGPELK